MDDEEGYGTPYAKFLERQCEAIEKILYRLILNHGEGKPIDGILEEIQEWLGDDWHINLSEADQARLDAIKGWTYG